MLSKTTVIRLASVLQLEDAAFVVGGQALNLWAERYAAINPKLEDYGPFTSKDLDYFGHREAAIKLAEALGGTVAFPDKDHHTPSVAFVQAEIAGDWVEVDFITDVIGVDRRTLEAWGLELIVPTAINGVAGELTIPVMHPLHCFQSRVANVIKLNRRTGLALDQMNAAPQVLISYIDEALAEGDVREAMRTLNALFHFLTRHLEGRQANSYLDADIVDVFRAFQADPRLDPRYRAFNLASIILRLSIRHAVSPKASGLNRVSEPVAP